MSSSYPRSFANLPLWAEANGVTIEEARLRFAQFVILCGIASVRSLREHLVFKGGNALDFVLQPNRSTIDLDFSLDMTLGSELADVDGTAGGGFNGPSSRHSDLWM